MRKKKRIAWTAISLVAAVAILIVIWWPRERGLLERSTRIPTLHIRKSSSYHWLSNDTLLLQFDSKAQIKRVEIATGVEMPLERLNQRLGQTNSLPACQISANGKWLLRYGREARHHSYLATTLDDSRSIQHRIAIQDVSILIASNPLWMSDSRRWVQVLSRDTGPPYAVVQSLDTPAIVHKIPFSAYPKGTIGYGDAIQPRLLGFVRPNRVLAAVGTGSPTGWFPTKRVDLFEFDVGGKAANLREYTVWIVAGTWLDAGACSRSEEPIALSPHGDRLAWLVCLIEEPSVEQPSVVTKFLGKWFPSLRPAPRHILQLRTSRLDGSGVHEIGRMEIPNNTASTELPHNLSWLPDGKRLSFIYQQALWTVPAD